MIAYIFPDSDPSDDLPLKERTSSTADKAKETPNPDTEPPPSSQPAAEDSPPAVQPPTTISHKKGGRPPTGRKGKLGRNQYTRDKDANDSGAGDDNSPGRSQSRDASRDGNGSTHDRHGHGHSHHRSMHSESRGGHGSHRKGASGGGHKVTMSDMKKKVALMLEFIQRTQLEMAEMAETAKIIGMDLGDAAADAPGSEGMKEIMKGLAGEILPALRGQDSQAEKEKEKEIESEKGVEKVDDANGTEGENGSKNEKSKEGEQDTPGYVPGSSVSNTSKPFNGLTLLQMMDASP